MYSTYGPILATLQIIIEGDDRAKAVGAEEILPQVKSFKFLVTLVLFWRILSYTKGLSDHLQKTQTDLQKHLNWLKLLWKLCKHSEQMKNGINTTNT